MSEVQSETPKYCPKLRTVTVAAGAALRSSVGIGVAWAFLWAGAIMAGACAHDSYRDAVGYRARQAALQGEFEAFEPLMEEAATIEPRSPLFDPKRTVLVHFFEMAEDPRFMRTIESWRAKGWISSEMTCAVHQAQWRGLHLTNPALADRSASICVNRARVAARNPDRAWELRACLEDAAFLVETSSTTRAGYLRMVGDPREPLAFRRVLLENLVGKPPRPPSQGADGRAELERHGRRLDALIAQVRTGTVPPALIASATALPALSLERALVPYSRSYIAQYADTDLPWGWVRTMKARKEVSNLVPLGIWEDIEGDGFWFACDRNVQPRTQKVTGGDQQAKRARSRRILEPGRPGLAGPGTGDQQAKRAASPGERRRVGPIYSGPGPGDQQAKRAASPGERRPGGRPIIDIRLVRTATPTPHADCLGPFPLEITARTAAVQEALHGMPDSPMPVVRVTKRELR